MWFMSEHVEERGSPPACNGREAESQEAAAEMLQSGSTDSTWEVSKIRSPNVVFSIGNRVFGIWYTLYVNFPKSGAPSMGPQ